MNQMNWGICVCREDIVKMVCLVKFRVYLGKKRTNRKKRASIWVFSRRHELQAYFLLRLSVPEYKKKLDGK